MKNYTKKYLKASNGITLIALVITIIVLLILAGISIAMLSGDNGILSRATDAKTKTERQSVVEQARTDVLGYQAENKGTDLQKNQLQTVLETYFKEVPDLTNMSDTEILNKKLETLAKYGTHNIMVKEIFDGNFTSSEENNTEIVEGVLGEWETNEAGDTLTKYLGSSKNIVIPNKYNGKNITAVGENIFFKSDIESLKISNGIIEIKSGAFSTCSNLNGNLELPNGLKIIGSGAFGMDSGLQGDLIIPESVTTIEPGAFASCRGLTGKLKIGSQMENIQATSFNACQFSSVEINMKNIPDNMFAAGGADIVEEIILGSNVETIGYQSFASNTKLTKNLILGDNIKSIGQYAFVDCGRQSSEFSINVSDKIETIQTYAFQNVPHVYYTGSLDTTNWGAQAYN